MHAVREYLQELGTHLSRNTVAIIGDHTILHAIERLFQLTVDTAIDINVHLILVENISVPDDYRNMFIVLGERNVLPYEFALRIANSVGLRNKLVHKYEEVLKKKMIEDMKAGLSQYHEYLKYIDEYLKLKARA
ncbi:MAG: hypothetical protein UX17_C0061G0003 [Parcubacteria group bacterium GW2011_GWC2_45_7]|nr:MAG: hypothetical protein UX17_C0061G0003 [Parcubacteria group bacterium GW2011_GWC2_45_7]